MAQVSYGGFILEVNLSNRKVEKKETPKSLCKTLLGGKGFGTYTLYKRLQTNIDPLSPDNILVISVGPAAGTRVFFASKVNFNFKSPLTGGYAESQMGGYFAPYMKWAGYDMIIISGASNIPVYLYIDENGAEIRSAEHLWGKTTFEVENILKKEIKDKVATIEIGPAGENLVKYACICHANGWRQAGRAGSGAVMGSKKLKAIALVADKHDVEVANEDMLKELLYEISEHMKKDPVGTLAENYRKYGTPIMVEIANNLGFFPTKYWSAVRFEKFEEIGPKAMSRYLISSRACWNCPFACGKLIEIKEGEYAGTRIEGPEYETIFTFGGLCMIDDFPAIAKINEICDGLGLDTISAGNVTAFAIEAYKLGKLKAERPVSYGDAEGIIWLLEQIAHRKSVGDLLAEGVRKAAMLLGMENIAVESKGLEPPGYDPRSLPGMALAYALSSRGACHLRAVMYAVDISGKVDRYSIDSNKVFIYVDNENRFNIFDSLVLCRFARNIFDWQRLSKLIRALTGFNYDVEDLKTIAHRIQTLIRLVNIRFGFSAKDDTISRRFMNEPVEPEKNKTVKVNEYELHQAIRKYYEIRGWDEYGIPTTETLEKLKIEEIEEEK